MQDQVCGKKKEERSDSGGEENKIKIIIKLSQCNGSVPAKMTEP